VPGGEPIGSEERDLTRDIRWPAVGILAVFVVVGAFTRHPQDLAASAVGCTIAIGAASILAALDARGWLALALATIAGVGVVVDAGAHGNCVAWFGLCVLTCWVMIAAGLRLGLPFFAAAEAVLIAHLLRPTVNLGWLPWIAGVAVSAGAAALILHEQNLVIQLRAAQAGLAERSRAEERNRIARDLHDVIAHSLTVSLLHMSSARLALADSDDRDEAARALAEAEGLARHSLEEVRSIVGLMRSDDGSSSLAPLPGVEALDDLVERFRGAGAEVTLERVGAVDSLPATASTTLYRIAQEAFTNAAKHAPGSVMSVRLASTNGRVELTVDSAGAPGGGRGMGLETMRERAEAIGGTCEAGPGGPGWRVRASVPVKEHR
jgi:signal transduction histidine kinase